MKYIRILNRLSIAYYNKYFFCSSSTKSSQSFSSSRLPLLEFLYLETSVQGRSIAKHTHPWLHIFNKNTSNTYNINSCF